MPEGKEVVQPQLQTERQQSKVKPEVKLIPDKNKKSRDKYDNTSPLTEESRDRRKGLKKE